MGLATKLINYLIEKIRTDYPHIVKISLSVYEKQTQAINLYKKLGFKEYGVFEKEMYVNGKYLNQVAMEFFF